MRTHFARFMSHHMAGCDDVAGKSFALIHASVELRSEIRHNHVRISFITNMNIFVYLLGIVCFIHHPFHASCTNTNFIHIIWNAMDRYSSFWLMHPTKISWRINSFGLDESRVIMRCGKSEIATEIMKCSTWIDQLWVFHWMYRSYLLFRMWAFHGIRGMNCWIWNQMQKMPFIQNNSSDCDLKMV